MLKFGIILPNYGPQTSRLAVVDTTLAAESLGFESVWTTDHIALPEADAERFGVILEAVTTLAYLAGCTRTIKLGVSALVLPQRNPLEAAKQIATLDVLSGGRAMLACGVGWSEGEFSALGYDFHNRGKRMDEALQVLRTLWRGTRLSSYTGEFYKFDRLTFAPAPIQSGGPRLWVGGNDTIGLRRAIKFADGWHPNGRTPELLAQALSPYKAILALRPFTVALRLSLEFSGESKPEMILSGSVEHIIQMLKDFEQAGMTDAILNFVSPDQAGRERAMQLFADKIMPVFR